MTFAVDNLASYISQIEAGTMRALAVTSAQRWPTLPNVPTMAEVGVPDFVMTSWAAYVMPIATAPMTASTPAACAHQGVVDCLFISPTQLRCKGFDWRRAPLFRQFG